MFVDRNMKCAVVLVLLVACANASVLDVTGGEFDKFTNTLKGKCIKLYANYRQKSSYIPVIK